MMELLYKKVLDRTKLFLKVKSGKLDEISHTILNYDILDGEQYGEDLSSFNKNIWFKNFLSSEERFVKCSMNKIHHDYFHKFSASADSVSRMVSGFSTSIDILNPQRYQLRLSNKLEVFYHKLRNTKNKLIPPLGIGNFLILQSSFMTKYANTYIFIEASRKILWMCGQKQYQVKNRIGRNLQKQPKFWIFWLNRCPKLSRCHVERVSRNLLNLLRRKLCKPFQHSSSKCRNL